MALQSGIQFPEIYPGQASTTQTGREIFSAAVGSSEHALSVAILKENKWRKHYMAHIPKVVEVASRSEGEAESMAERGLKACYDQFQFIRNGKKYRLQQAMEKFSSDLFFTAEIQGTKPRESFIQVNHKNNVLQGTSLRHQIGSWIEAGIIEAEHGYDVLSMVDDESSRNLSGQTFILLGAGSEVGPLKTLLSLGARVIAIARAKPDNWKRLISMAQNSAGSLVIPCKHNPENMDHEQIAHVAGADLLTQAPEIAYWLNGFKAPMTLGSYAYLDGAKHVQVAMAMDAIAQYLIARRQDISLSYLLTPSDVYSIPNAIAKHGRNRFFSKSLLGLIKRSVCKLSAGYLYAPSIGEDIKDDKGRRLAVLDNLVNQQGPNYVLAKHIQRWRAISSSKQNIKVSCNVAPASSTESVTSNQFFAAAIWGSESFGVEVFSPNTVNTLMTLQMLSDLKTGADQKRGEALFVSGANHGGAWRIGYCFRSLLVPSLIVGFALRLKFKHGKSETAGTQNPQIGLG